MTMRTFWCCATLGLLVSMLAGPAAGEGTETDPLGRLRIYEPVGSMRGFVVLYSDEAGWDRMAEEAAVELGRRGALVAGVDLSQYRERIDRAHRKCAALVGDAEATSRDLQRARNYPDYHSPILAGIGAGGVLAEIILRSSPPATLTGVVSIDPRPLASPQCAVEPSRHAGKPLPGFWTVASKNRSGQFSDTIDAAGSAVDVRVLRPQDDYVDALVDSVSPHLDPERPATGVARLPLIELPASVSSQLLAIVLSGDGGWRDLDKVIAEELSHNGISVIGWDSLRYFWSQKTTAEATRDLAAVIDEYSKRWGSTKVALIGYSFGADVLPFLYDELPRQTRQRVAQISLLGLSNAADFEIKVTGWVGGTHGAAARPTKPALASIDPALIQCFYGEGEDDTLCPELARRGSEAVRTKGGHHFDGDYPALAQRILAGFKVRAR